MTVHQLKEPCWELVPPLPGYDRGDHYDTEAEARKALRRALEDETGVDPETKPRMLGDRCWVVRCDGDCGQHIAEEEESYTSHCETRVLAEEVMASWEWAYRGEQVFCPADAPSGAELPPPSPAELEAAGQLRLPGVA